ncbi:MAG TPA: ABC transporter permease [Candidatus Sulfobium mesophilum]|nr:ABC transporter permease [Candidatus Sulfobium mesophilum]
MSSYIIKRVILLIPMLLGITMITFALTKALPGDPVYTMVGERSSLEIIEKVRREIGADKGTVRQYIGYVSLLAKGEMGRSYYTNRKVLDDIKSRFPKTLVLAAGAMFVAVPPGIGLGLLAALRKGAIADRIISTASMIFISVPVFWSGLLIMLFFSLSLKLLPPSGTGGPRYILLPSLTLALPALATIIRVTRVSVLDVVNMPFIRTARAKGIKEKSINTLHIMKNALIPVVTVIGLDFGSYLNGAVLTETIFGWDGIGRFMMEGIIKRDYPVIMGCIIVGTVIFVLINLLVDVIYHYVDPRVRLHGTDR